SSPRESGPAQTRVREHDGRPFRFVSAPANTGIEGAQPAKVLVALDVAFHRQFMTDFRNSLWLTVAVGIALSELLGWFSARWRLLPARKALELMHPIAGNRLSGRLPPGSGAKEPA